MNTSMKHVRFSTRIVIRLFFKIKHYSEVIYNYKYTIDNYCEMKLPIVSIHKFFLFSFLLSFPKVESMGGRWYPACMAKRRSMAQSDLLMVPTQSKQVENDYEIPSVVTYEKNKLIESKASIKTKTWSFIKFDNILAASITCLES